MNRILSYFVFLILCSCNNSGKNDKPASEGDSPYKHDSVSHEPAAQKTEIVSNHKASGIYQAVLPCSNCKGWRHTVGLYPDLSFRMEDEKWEPLQKTALAGKWQQNGEVIDLLQGARVVRRYYFRNDSLFFPLEDKEFPMQKAMDPFENKTWKGKGDAGVEFYGIGNEPFWNIEIDEEKKILFRLADWEAPVVFDPVRPQTSSDSMIYSTRNDKASLRIIIYNRFCSDGMSDFIYRNEVKLFYNNDQYKGCGLLFRRS